MSASIFPIVQPAAAASGPAALPVYREVQWDYLKNIPVFRRGAPVVVEKGAAVLVWAWKALHTPRFRHEIYTWAYGCELEALVGQPYTGDLKRAEAIRYVREALEPNPYISSVNEVSVTFDGDVLTIECTVETIYGSVEVSAIV